MSRMPPGRPYGYGPAPRPHPPHPVIASNYYYDETEGYVADYSESDALSDGPHPHLVSASPRPPDVTEIYRRKSAVTSPPERYQGVYLHPDYYYDMPPQAHPPPQQIRRLSATPAVTYRRRIPVTNDMQRYYRPDPGDQNYDTMVFRSSPQITTIRRVSPLRVPSATLVRPPTPIAVRRHPVTVRTPRYYRRPAANAAVYKRPSALCLPVACQPDPAVYRRTRRVIQQEPIYRHPHDVVYQAQAQQRHPGKALSRRHSIAIPSSSNPSNNVQKSESTEEQEHINVTNSDLDAMLAKYEKIFADTKGEGDSRKSESSTSKVTGTRNVPMLKPKVPPSIKAKHERLQRLKTAKTKNTKSTKNIERLDVEEITTDVLDNLLSELMSNGCKNSIEETKEKNNRAPAQAKQEESAENQHKRHNKEHPAPKSFNYDEISQNLSKSQDFLGNEYGQSRPPSPKQQRPEERQIVPKSNSKGVSLPQTSMKMALDETSALELHRSKSYIVNLIDRALSRELGTAPEEKQGCSLYPTTAIETANKQHADCKMDKEMCLEITHALADPYVANTSASAAHCDQRLEMGCPFAPTPDEPLYVKQLKQLRWGHLKHIQREVRRLEDLERFLDSCGSGSYF